MSLKQTEVASGEVIIRFPISAQFPMVTAPFNPAAPPATSQSPKGPLGKGQGSHRPSRHLPGGAQRGRASFPRQRRPVPPAERARSTRRPARPGPRGPGWTRGQPRGTRAPPDGLGDASYGGSDRDTIGGNGERRRAPSPYLEQVQVSPRNPTAGVPRCNGALPANRWDASAAAGSRWPAGNRAPAAGEGRSAAAPAPTPGRSAPAPRPPPPAGTPPARARSGVFAPLLSEGGAGSAPGRTGKLGTAGASRRPDAGWCAGGVLICLSEREDCSEAQQQLDACVPRSGWALAVGSGQGTATSRKRRDLACEGAGFEVLPGGFRVWGLRPIRRSLRGKGKRTFFIFFLLLSFWGEDSTQKLETAS